MSDLPAEAVEAAYRAYCEARKGKPLAPGEYEATYSRIEVAWLITALTAAAPYIAAQAQKRDAERIADAIVQKDALSMQIMRERDRLHGGIKALRDEMPVLTTELCGHEPDVHPEGCCDVCDLAFAIDSEVRDRLDALLREGE